MDVCCVYLLRERFWLAPLLMTASTHCEHIGTVITGCVVMTNSIFTVSCVTHQCCCSSCFLFWNHFCFVVIVVIRTASTAQREQYVAAVVPHASQQSTSNLRKAHKCACKAQRLASAT